MRLLGLFIASLCSFSVLAAKKQAASTFETYHARAASASPLEIEDSDFDHLTAAPRDYTAAVLLTALEAKFGCQLCREFQPEWDIIAKSWQKADKKGESRILFSTLDFSRGRATFQKVC